MKIFQPTTSSGGGSGVTSLNSLTGALNLIGGSGISITPSGTSITIKDTSTADSVVSVRLGTTAALAAVVYNNGTSGIGATLTKSTNGVLNTIDGVAPLLGDRLLIKNQASTLQNGIYEITTLGSPTVKFILTRTTDADTTGELDELIASPSEGTTNRDMLFGQQTQNPTVGTSPVVFTTVSSIGVIQATTGTQSINQVPVYTGTARQITRGTPDFTFNPLTKVFNVGDISATSGKTQFSLDDTSGIAYIKTRTSFTVRDENNNLALFSQTDGGDMRFRAGDVSAAFNGTVLDVSDTGQSLSFNKPNVSINTVPYIWTGTQGGANTYLKNDGAGNLTWATVSGGGSPGGADTNVQYNDGGSAFGGDSSFTWNKTNKIFNVGDTTGGVHDTNLTVDAQHQRIFLQNLGNIGIGDAGNQGNETLLTINDASSLITGFGNKVITNVDPAIDSLVFTGAGLDDISINPLTYSGSSASFTVTVDGINRTTFPLGGLTGSFAPGDLVTDSTSGATGTYVSVTNISGTNYITLSGVSGTFSSLDSVFGTPSGATATIAGSVVVNDTVTITDGSTTVTGFPMQFTSQSFSGLEISWGAFTGHTLTNNWTFNITSGSSSTAYGTMMSLDGAGRDFQFGDVDNIGNSIGLNLDDGNKIALLKAPFGIVKVGDPGSGDGAVIIVDDTTHNIILTAGNAHNTNLTVDDANKQISVDSLGKVFIGDVSAAGNSTQMQIVDDDGLGGSSITASVKSVFRVVDIAGDASIEADNQSFQVSLGDVSSTINGTKIVIDDPDNQITAATGGVTYLNIQGALPLLTLGDGSTISALQLSAALAQIHIPAVSGLFSVTDTGNTSLLSIETSSATNNGTLLDINDETQRIKLAGTIVEANIGSTTYGGTLNYSAGFAGKARAFFSGSHSGTPTGLLLPTGVNAPIGTKFTVDDLGGLATTDPITVDAGTSNTITGTTGTAQTFVINSNGESLTIVKLSSTQWMVE